MKNKIILYYTDVFVLLFKLLLIFCSFYYLTMVLSPVIQRDGWYYVYQFGQKWIENGISFEDFLEKRSLTDTSIPLLKIWLYFNLKYFDLDFRIEGLLGFFALVGIVLFGYFMYKKSEYQSKNWVSAVWICNGSLVLLSPLNTETYYWSLSMLGYTYPFLGILCSFLLWSYLKNEKGNQWLMFPILLILFLCGDIASLIMSSALLFSTILAVTSTSSFWKDRQKISSLSILTLFSLLYFFLLNFKYIGSGLTTDQGLNSSSLLDNFIKNISNINIYKYLFTRGIIGSNYLLQSVIFFEIISILTIFSLLIYFVFRIIKNRGIRTFIDFTLFFLFLYFLFSIFLILVGRSTLDTPRYGPIFQLLPIVLLWTPAFVAQSHRKMNQVLNIMCSLFIFIALSLNYGYNTYRAFSGLKYEKAWENRTIEIIAEIFENRYDGEDCSLFHGSFGICDVSDNDKKYILDFLNKMQLNIFNPKFQSIYRIQPFSIGLNRNKILFWGPQGFVLGDTAIPNILPDGNMGMYFQLSNHFGLDDIALQVGELMVPTINGGNGLLTASVDLTGITDSKNIIVSLIDKKQNITLTVGEFKIIK